MCVQLSSLWNINVCMWHFFYCYFHSLLFSLNCLFCEIFLITVKSVHVGSWLMIVLFNIQVGNNLFACFGKYELLLFRLWQSTYSFRFLKSDWCLSNTGHRTTVYFNPFTGIDAYCLFPMFLVLLSKGAFYFWL